MAPDSLVDMARRTCARNIRNLYSIGALRVELIKPLLTKIENPDQLHALELNSPSVLPHTKEAWLSLLRRHIPNLESRLPQNYQTTLFADENAERWHMIYKKLRKQVDKEVAARDKQLAAQLADSNAKVVAPVIDRPRNIVQTGRNKYSRAAAAYTTSLYKSGKPGGPSFFERVRASDRARQAARLATPTHLLKPRIVNGVTKAPAALVEELRHRKQVEAEQREKDAEVREQKRLAEREGRMTVKPPRAMGVTSFGMGETKREPKVAKPPLHGGNYDLTRDREERLRALKAGKTPQKPSMHEIAKLTADFLEDDDGDQSDEVYHRSSRLDLDDGDLFDERPRKPPMKAEPVQTQSPRPSGRTASPMKTETKKVMPAPVASTSHMGPIIRKRKDPPTLFRPSKR